MKAVSRMTFLQQLDWGVVVDSSTTVVLDDESTCTAASTNRKKTECIPFLPEDCDTDVNVAVVDLLPEYVSINQMLERLSVNLPDSKIRVFKVPPPNVK